MCIPNLYRKILCHKRKILDIEMIVVFFSNKWPSKLR
jgi:hypothetical protein